MQITIDIPDWIIAEYLDAETDVEQLVLEDILLARESDPGPESRAHIREQYQLETSGGRELRTSSRS
jgi:hypothetical protein